MTIKELLDSLNTEQKVKFAILCAKKVCKSKKWNVWADKWLSGEDRNEYSCYDILYVAYRVASKYSHFAAIDACYAAAFSVNDDTETGVIHATIRVVENVLTTIAKQASFLEEGE